LQDDGVALDLEQSTSRQSFDITESDYARSPSAFQANLSPSACSVGDLGEFVLDLSGIVDRQDSLVAASSSAPQPLSTHMHRSRRAHVSLGGFLPGVVEGWFGASPLQAYDLGPIAEMARSQEKASLSSPSDDGAERSPSAGRQGRLHRRCSEASSGPDAARRCSSGSSVAPSPCSVGEVSPRDSALSQRGCPSCDSQENLHMLAAATLSQESQPAPWDLSESPPASPGQDEVLVAEASRGHGPSSVPSPPAFAAELPGAVAPTTPLRTRRCSSSSPRPRKRMLSSQLSSPSKLQRQVPKRHIFATETVVDSDEEAPAGPSAKRQRPGRQWASWVFAQARLE